MAWIAGAIVAVFLLWRFPRATIVTVISLAAIAAVGFLVNDQYDRRERKNREMELSKIAVFVEFAGKCKDPQYPLWVQAGNTNDFSVDSVSISIWATEPGHSTKLYSGYVKNDRILKKNEGYGVCWRLDDYKLQDGKIEGREPKNLNWNGSVSYIDKSE